MVVFHTAYGQKEVGLEILSDIRGFYEKNNAFEMSIRYDYFENGKLKESLAGEIKAKGALYYSAVGQHQSINNKNCFLHIDGENKRINVFESQKMDFKELVKFPVDSTITRIERIQVDTVDGYGRLRVYFQAGYSVNQSEFVYHLSNRSLLSYSMHFPSENSLGKILKINFLKYTKGFNQAKDIFSESPYIIIKDKDNVLATKAYANYQVFNFLNLEK